MSVLFRVGMSQQSPTPVSLSPVSHPSPVLVPTARTSPVFNLQVRHGEEEIHIMLKNLLKELLPVPQFQLLLLHLLCIQVPLGLLHLSWGEKVRRVGAGRAV